MASLLKFITANREELIARTRAKVSKRLSPRPTESELTGGVPLFLDQLVETLRITTGPAPAPAIEFGAARHGAALLDRGYTVA